MKRYFLLTVGCLMAASCAYPTSTVEQGAPLARFKIADAPLGATILVDGRAVGSRSSSVADFFPVEAGVHVVEERVGDRMLLKKSFSIDLGATIEVRNAQ